MTTPTNHTPEYVNGIAAIWLSACRRAVFAHGRNPHVNRTGGSDQHGYNIVRSARAIIEHTTEEASGERR